MTDQGKKERRKEAKLAAARAAYIAANQKEELLPEEKTARMNAARELYARQMTPKDVPDGDITNEYELLPGGYADEEEEGLSY